MLSRTHVISGTCSGKRPDKGVPLFRESNGRRGAAVPSGGGVRRDDRFSCAHRLAAFAPPAENEPDSAGTRRKYAAA